MKKIFKISILLLGILGLGMIAYKTMFYKHLLPLSKTDKLYEAISNNNLEEAQKLIDEGAHVNGDPGALLSLNPLGKAIREGNPEMVQMLIDKGATVTETEKRGRSLLDLAIGSAMGVIFMDLPAPYFPYKVIRDNQKRKIIPLLIKANAPTQYPAIIPALLTADLNQVKKLTQETKDSLKANKQLKDTILRAAIHSNDKAIIDYVIDVIIGRNAINKSGELLQTAIETDDQTIIDYILIHPLTDLNAKTPPFDYSPLHTAVMNPGNPTVVQKLLEKGANPNTQNEEGETPLHIALKAGDREPLVKLLIEHGADLTIRNKEGKSAQDLLDAQK